MCDNPRPSQETRGGDKINWRNAVPGEPLPTLLPEETADPPDNPGELDYNASADDGRTYSAFDADDGRTYSAFDVEEGQ
jgi:hypothetical protein